MARTIIAALAAGLLLAGAGASRAAETPSTADPGAKNVTQTQGTVTETPKASTEQTDVNKGAGSGTGTMPPAGNSGETKK